MLFEDSEVNFFEVVDDHKMNSDVSRLKSWISWRIDPFSLAGIHELVCSRDSCNGMLKR